MTGDCNPEAVASLVRLGLEIPGEGTTEIYNVHGVTTRVITNSAAVSEVIAKFLRPFGTAPAAEPDIDFHLFLVQSLEKDMSPVPSTAEELYDWGTVKVYHREYCRYLKVDDRARVTADLERGTAAGFADQDMLESDWLISNLFFYPLWGQLLKVNGLFPLHAAGLAEGGKASLFLGRSGSGKSTLALSLVRAGFGLLSDDTVFIRESAGGVEVLSFPEDINIREETLKLLPELSRVKKFNVNQLRQKSSFHIEELYPGCIVESAVPAMMVFPEITDKVSTEAEPVSGPEALSESLRYGFFFLDPATTEKHFRVLSRLANQVKSYRLYSGSDQKELVRQIRDLLDGDASDRDN